MFSNFINVLECLASAKFGMTITAIAKKSGLQYAQVKTILRKLEGEQMVRHETKPHRPNINKSIWHILPRADEYCHIVTKLYGETF